MKAVYTLIWNPSPDTGPATRAPASSRCRRRAGGRLAAAMALALGIPAGPAWAADDVQDPRCAAGQARAADATPCEAGAAAAPLPRAAGTVGIGRAPRQDGDDAQYLSVGGRYHSGGSVEGPAQAQSGAIALGRAASAGDVGVALGENAGAAHNGVAAGYQAKAAATFSTALGRRAQVAAGAGHSVALGADSHAERADSVSIGNATLKRQLVNVAAGTTASDAVTVGQLQPLVTALGGGAAIDPATGRVTGPRYQVGGATRTTVGDALGNLDGRVTSLEGSGAGPALVTFDPNTQEVNVATGEPGGRVNFGGASGHRVLSGVAAGNLGSTSTDAVNGSQLFATNTRLTTAEGNLATQAARVGHMGSSLAAALGGGATFDPDGSITAPRYRIAGSEYASVGDAFGAVDRSLDDLSAGAGGLVRYDAASGTVQVATAEAGDRVDFSGTAGGRVLSGVAAGVADSDAASFGQLKGSVQSIADGLGGGATVGADGRLGAPRYRVGGTDHATVGDAFTAVDVSLTGLEGRVAGTEGDVVQLTHVVKELSSGGIGIVTYDAAVGAISVGLEQGGDIMDMQGQDGRRRVTGVANGIHDGDVVTMAQLRAAGALDPASGELLSVLTYDDSRLDRVTLGGSQGTVLGNLANGVVAAGSREAVNGGQLWDVGDRLQGQLDGLGGRVGRLEDALAGPGPGPGGGSGGPVVAPGSGERSVAIGEGAEAGGNGSVAIGDRAAANGEMSVAVGSEARASGQRAVAVGAGSTADRDNEFSVGSADNARVVGNVAAGTRATDAVNLQQLDDRLKAERDYTEGRLRAVDARMDRMGAISAAYAGMAINTAGLGGDNRIGAGVGSQNGHSALAVGYQRVLGQRRNASVSFGSAFSGSDRSVSAGAGFSW